MSSKPPAPALALRRLGSMPLIVNLTGTALTKRNGSISHVISQECIQRWEDPTQLWMTNLSHDDVPHYSGLTFGSRTDSFPAHVLFIHIGKAGGGTVGQFLSTQFAKPHEVRTSLHCTKRDAALLIQHVEDVGLLVHETRYDSELLDVVADALGPVYEELQRDAPPEEKVLPFLLPAVRRELKQRLKEAQLATRVIFSL